MSEKRKAKVIKLKRTMPQDLAAERSFLGGIIIKPDQGMPVWLTRDDFFDPQNKLVFDAISVLYQKGDPIDAVILSSTLESIGSTLDANFVAQIATEVPDPSSAPHYAKVIKRKAVLRAFLAKAKDAVDKIYESHVPEYEAELAHEVAWEFAELANQAILPDRKTMDEIWASGLAAFGKHIGIPVPWWPKIDREFVGLVPGAISVIAGRTSQGKTALGCNFAYHAAVQGYGVLYLTLEMDEREIAGRFLALDSGVSNRSTVDITPSFERLKRLPLVVRYQAPMKPKDVKTNALYFAREKTTKLSMIVVDYLGMMRGNRPEHRRWEEMSQVVRELKFIAEDLNVTIIVLSQINRDGDDDKPPRLSQLRDTGTLEEHSSNIFLVWQPPAEKRRFATKYTGQMVQVILAKQRNGLAPISFDMLFDRHIGKFTEVEDQEDPR